MRRSGDNQTCALERSHPAGQCAARDAGASLDIRALRKTYRYQRFRNRFMRRNPLCAECDRQGRVTVAVEMDHIVPVHKAPDRVWDETNLQALCLSCHIDKTARENEACGEGSERNRRWRKRFESVRSALNAERVSPLAEDRPDTVRRNARERHATNVEESDAKRPEQVDGVPSAAQRSPTRDRKRH